MKKFLSITLALLLVLSFSACSSVERIEEMISASSSKIENVLGSILSEIEKEISSSASSVKDFVSSFDKEGEDENEDEEGETPKKESVKEEDREDESVGSLTIQYIDVGQADAALVECNGEYLLIDGGNRGDSDVLYAILKRKGITHLNYVVGTHGHEDHIGGIAGALEACSSVGVVYSPVTEFDSKTFENFKKAAEEKAGKLTVPNAGDEFMIGNAKVKILGPVTEYEDPNNTSIVLKITFGKTSFLFTGDMEYDAEIDLIESGADVSADVLKVGHHGGSTSSCYRFLRAVAPKYGVISVGEGNSYGHPHDEPLSRLYDADVEVFRTDEVGDVICTSDGKNITFETKKF